MSEIVNRMTELAYKRYQAIFSLVAPARAAVNQMKDAGMTRGAEPLAQALFEFDAAEQEFKDLCKGNVEGVVDELIKRLRENK